MSLKILHCLLVDNDTYVCVQLCMWKRLLITGIQVRFHFILLYSRIFFYFLLTSTFSSSRLKQS